MYMYKYAEYLVATIESMSVRETKNQKQIALNVICIADVFSAITIPEEKKLINDPTPPPRYLIRERPHLTISGEEKVTDGMIIKSR